MSAPSLDIANVVTITVASPPVGLSSYQLNNLLILTKDTPLVSLTPGYGVYLTPAAVATDFGTGSETYAQAVAIFSQQPNLLTGGGQLIVAPMASNDLLTDKITAIAKLIFFGGVIWGGYAPDASEVANAAVTAKALKKLIFVPSHQTTDLNAGGLFYVLNGTTNHNARMFLFTSSAANARIAVAAYASRGMSTDFSGSQTTQTVHMKQLSGISPDANITQAILNTCETLGVDVYTNVAGIPEIFSTGGNDFFDNVYNLLWLTFALEVAGFNAIAQSFTKIPQTEEGIGRLKSAYILVLEQARTNGFIAPGAWNSTTDFGNTKDFVRCIGDQGYYVYSVPVNKQLQADRVARKAPLISIGIKLAGAVHSTSVNVFVNP
jgi:hypothetical protein